MPKINGMVISPDYDDFLGYADGYGAFAAWCEEVHQLAEHLLDTSFFEIEEMYDPEGYYYEQYSPIKYVRHVLIPEAVYDFGEDVVEQVIADNVMWGKGITLR